ncbi:MAG: SMC-Scp complex subunit ScpB [Candidatus Altiarchaeia archaeon]
MTDENKNLIEAALFVSGKILTLQDLARLCLSGSLGQIRKTLEDLQKEYELKDSSIEIYESNGGYGMRVKRVYEDKVIHLVPDTDMAPAVLKTLALIAYTQPIKQSEVIKLRGNGAYKYIEKLKDIELIETHKSSRTKIITVTNKFKEYFHIQEVKEMFKDIKPPEGAEDLTAQKHLETEESKEENTNFEMSK